ncbi:MAG: TonB-dependent receptor [Planctomycetota bacterium]
MHSHPRRRVPTIVWAVAMAFTGPQTIGAQPIPSDVPAPIAPGPTVEELERLPRSPVRLGDLVVTPNRNLFSSFGTPYSLNVLTDSGVLDRQVRSTPEALREIPGVMVQKTSHGQGSPYIRGFTGYQTVFLIDGIRLNNSVFRSGPNQYWNTVDPFSLERLEVVRGPAAALYGSDAVGGAVNALTRSPELGGERGTMHGRLLARASSAERSLIGRGEVAYSLSPDAVVQLGLTLKNFGDLEGGADVGKQRGTGYDEYAADLKSVYQLSANTQIVAAYQKVRQNDVPRTHSTMHAIDWHGLSIGSDRQRDLDQVRDLAYVQLHGFDLGGAVEGFRVSASWQRQQEQEDRIRSSGARIIQEFDANTFGLWAQAESDTPIGYLTYGVDWYHDQVDSRDSTNPIQGAVGDDADYDLVGGFVENRIAVCKQLDLFLAGRATYAHADIDSVEDFATGTATRFDDDYSELTGSARAVWTLDPEDRWNIFTGVSQAFRAPNLSDLSSLDDFGTSGFEIPARNLDPENFLTAEIGTKVETECFFGQAAYFYTWADDLILRRPTGPNPADPTQTIFEKVNSGDGWVQGIELEGAWRFHRQWSVFGNVTWMDGKVDFIDASNQKVEDTITRLMPTTGQIGVRWECTCDDLWIEGLARMADEQDHLSVTDAADTSRIPPGGTPGYAIFSLRAGLELNDRTTVRGAIENIFDTDYRVHGSGVNESGRSLNVSIEFRF